MKLVIGFITYGETTAKYLPYFLPSLKSQTFKNYKIVVVDNSEKQNNKNIEFIKKNYPEINIKWVGKNIGFAQAYNKMIKEAIIDGLEYILILNPDMVLEPETVEKLVKAMDNENNLGSCGPKILQWNFKNNKKTNIIDTCGIKLKPGLSFVDIGQAQINNNKFNNISILGPSGAAAIYRLSALEKIKFNNQYFDELMFMYKEDCDLAYRLFLADFESKCISEAIIYHDRTAAAAGESDIEIAKNRKRKSRQVKIWSFLNQQIIFLKYWRQQNFINKLAVIWFELKIVLFILFFEQYLLKEFNTLINIKSKIKIY